MPPTRSLTVVAHCTAGLLLTAGSLWACRRDAAAPTETSTPSTSTTHTLVPVMHPSSAPPGPTPTPDSSAASSCADIERAWRAELSSARTHNIRTCSHDEQCACYGGFKCPNELIDACPSPIRADVAKRLSAFDERWHAKSCGDLIWSPQWCDASCLNGRCQSSSSAH